MASIHTLLVIGVAAASLACHADETPANQDAAASADQAIAPEPEPDAAAGPSDPDHLESSLLGRQMPPWQVAAWANTEALDLAALRGKVVVVRFWTDTCPYCKASMPALQGLAEQFADQPVAFVGLFHEKPKGRPEAWRDAQQTAQDWGITFAIGHDANWSTLQSWWLSTGERAATSSTIVLGKGGEVIHVHPGPVYFPSDEAEDAQPNRDFVALREAISLGLANGA